MGDAGAFLGSGVDFMSDRMAEKHEAEQRDIDRIREDLYNQQQQQNWQTQFDYQKQLNQTQMEREDNAVQRSVADHQAAGFNKLLAVGNQSAAGGMTTFGGNAGGGVSSQIPQSRGTNFLQLAQTIMDNRVKQSMISKSKAEADYTNQKTLSEVENTGILSIKKLREELARTKDVKDREYLEKQIEEIQTRIDTARHNLGLGQKHKLPVGTDPRANNIYQILTGDQEVNAGGTKPTGKAKEGTRGKAVEKSDGSGNYAVSQNNAPRGFGPPNEEESKYAWYFDKKNGQWYRFGKIWFGE